MPAWRVTGAAAQEGVRGQGAAMRFVGLKARYRKEYAELTADARGQGELL